MFFSIRKDLFKPFEVLRRRGKNQTSSSQEGFFILGGLRKKYLARCQVLRSKYYLYTNQQKLFFNIVKDTFKSFEVLSRRGKIKISSEGERIFVLDGLRNKYLARCLILRSNYYLYTVLKKVFFSIRKDLFKSFEVLRRRGKNQTSSSQEGFFILGGLRKKYLARCKILRSKYHL